MRKHIKKLHTHLKNPAKHHHYIAFMAILAWFATLSVWAFVTYAADEQLCNATMTDCSPTPVVDVASTSVADYADNAEAKAIIKLKVNTLPVYQRLYGKNSKEVRGLKKLITSLTRVHSERMNATEDSSDKPRKELKSTDEDVSTQKIKTPIKKIATKLKESSKLDTNDNKKSDITLPAIKEWTKLIKSEPNESEDKAVKPVKSVSNEPTKWTKAMTWVVRDRAEDGVIQVGYDAITNPYVGDTDVNSMLPMLCVNKQQLPLPEVLVKEYEVRLQNNNKYDDVFYNGWIGWDIKMTTPLVWSMITSRDVADMLCVNQFGDWWEFAEFHSPQWWRARFAYGELPVWQRLWVWINDKPSNPWGAGW